MVLIIFILFDSVILECYADCLLTDDLQFGFKRGMGCTNAIFSLRTTIDHFTSRGGSIYAAALDIRKAFDTVHHFKLFKNLITSGMPKCLVAILMSWYSTLEIIVRWNMSFSKSLHVGSGVRQGGVLSPSLFNIFINSMIVNLRKLNQGCHINNTFLGCCMYADDLIVLSASLGGLQKMLDQCVETCNMLSLQFNAKKSNCIYLGPKINLKLDNLRLGFEQISWSDSMKYLGITFVNEKHLSVDIGPIRRKFFIACNSLLSNSSNLNELSLCVIYIVLFYCGY